MRKNRVAILGCGFLGSRLGRLFVENGDAVLGSAVHDERIEALSRQGIRPCKIVLHEDHIEYENASSFWDCDCLYILLPFRRSLKDPWTYLSQIKTYPNRPVIRAKNNFAWYYYVAWKVFVRNLKILMIYKNLCECPNYDLRFFESLLFSSQF